jgi:hypothetical protein
MPTESQTPAPVPATRIVLNQLYAAVILILAGAGAGIAGAEISTKETAIAIGTALIGAGAAMLPAGAAAHASASEALAPLVASASMPPAPVPPVPPVGPTDPVAANDPTLAGLVDPTTNGVPADEQYTTGAQRQVDGDL